MSSVFVRDDGRAVVPRAGSVLLVETVRKTGLDEAISVALAPWRKPRAVHDPGKLLVDLALAVALGGDCLTDNGMLRAEPGVFGPVASYPTVSRLIDTLATARARRWPPSAPHDLKCANGPGGWPASGHQTPVGR
ncbi:Transposase DDE domain group 1 [Streptomyces sp. MnatMP-M17]|nr:Transposase DDE domain group 1 [Streptomyces sp. MnatMP-M17]